MLSKTKEYRNAYQKKWLEADPARMRGRNLIKYWPICSMYGAGLRYEELFKEQNGKCAICGQRSEVNLDVDHCHQSGKVRGLLCSPCNRGLGFFRENSKALREAASYIERSKEFVLTVQMQEALQATIRYYGEGDPTWEKCVEFGANSVSWPSKSERQQFEQWALTKMRV